MSDTATPENDSFSVLAADLMARLTIAKFTDEDLFDLVEGDTYQETVDALGYDPLTPEGGETGGNDTDQR